jgi:membrane protease YdiL (CAAX protease family)
VAPSAEPVPVVTVRGLPAQLAGDGLYREDTVLTAWGNTATDAVLLALLPVVPAAAAGVSYLRAEQILLLMALACLVGLVEEAFFRGLILQALAPAGLWRAAVLSSAVFGVMHLLNLLYGADLVATLLQTASATALGLGLRR